VVSPAAAPDPVAAYAAALERYVAGGGELDLEAAYALGRRAVADGMTLLALIEQHRSAGDLLTRGGTRLGPDTLDATFRFLSEALATFEMAQRGYWEATEMAARERAIALMLQHDLLPAAVPPVEGLDVAVRYLPGEATSHAGGDWYDLFRLDDDRVGLVVGDVTGHGVGAAAAMGQLRIAVLAYALAGFAPGDVVARIDALLEALGRGDVATMVYAIVDPGREELMVANAGHPPPIVVEPGGRPRVVHAGKGLLLGLDPTLDERTTEATPVPVGSHLLFYTDGLIEPLERQDRDGVDHLLQVTDGFTGTADDLCRHVLAELTPEQSGDDICILAATLAP
jgi:serine phosphatase RsbU (regulator of sigma subunit)